MSSIYLNRITGSKNLTVVVINFMEGELAEMFDWDDSCKLIGKLHQTNNADSGTKSVRLKVKERNGFRIINLMFKVKYLNEERASFGRVVGTDLGVIIWEDSDGDFRIDLYEDGWYFAENLYQYLFCYTEWAAERKACIEEQ
jgi:hypothetical protein